jgi:FdhD protein
LGFASPTESRGFLRLDGARTHQATVEVAEEVPVAFVYNRRPHVVMMATPADLEDLAFGFTTSERIATAGQISDVMVERHDRGIELAITIPAEAGEQLAQRSRAIAGRTGCGLCGVEAIDDAVRAPTPVHATWRLLPDALWTAAQTLGAQQTYNNATHALHAAAWATPDGELRVVREDVGRHNALDKVFGALARRGADPTTGFVLLTSRASFEMVQKAATMGVPLVAAVSRPTALAVRLATAAGITLVTLVRGMSADVHTHPDRLLTSPVP